MKFIIENDTIKALLLAAAKKDVRYYLNGILFDVREHDAVAVATDGHILLAVPLSPELDENGTGAYVPGQYIVSREALESIKPSKLVPMQFEFDSVNQSVTISSAGAHTTVKLTDARFPEWRRVVPATVTDHVSQFDAEYVGTFGKIQKLLGGKYSPAIRHNGCATGDQNGVASAARVILAGDAVGVIMPMRYDVQPLENPSWLEYPSAKVSAAA